MKIEDQVCSLEQAKELEKLGVRGETSFYWKVNEIQSVVTDKQMKLMIEKYLPTCNDYFPAYSVAELGMMLPQGEELPCKLTDHGSEWGCVGWYEMDFDATTEARSRARMLIYLLRNKMVTKKEANQRLIS